MAGAPRTRFRRLYSSTGRTWRTRAQAAVGATRRAKSRGARERPRAYSRSLAGSALSAAFSLIVTDTSPLFTLVLADSLDVLLRPGLGVSIPDAVYVEATRVRGAPGAEQIVAWINANLDAVRIV